MSASPASDDRSSKKSPRDLCAQLVQDAIELARAMRPGAPRGEEDSASPAPRDVLRFAATNDSFRVLALCRLREAVRRFRVPGASHVVRMTTTLLYAIEIGNGVELGDGVCFVHPLGTVVGGTTRVGNRVRFMGNNTVGTAKDNGYPVIGDDVLVGCGARILGPVRVGAGAVIGANAVVLDDVPAGVTVAGIPARPVGGERARGAHGADASVDLAATLFA